MRISIFGLGYVGCVSMGCLAHNGHNVIGVDVSKEKVDQINNGQATIVEKGIDLFIKKYHSTGRVRATQDCDNAVQDSDITFMCIGTPSSPTGHLNLDHIFIAAKQIGESLKKKGRFHIIVIRSTVLPGTSDKITSIIEEESGKTVDTDFAVVSNPEFLREGTAVHDYLNPPLTVMASSSEIALSTMKEVYSNISAPIEIVDVNVAEMIKYVNNSFHALKVVFANEVGNLCKASGIDSHEVMRLFCMDKQLNISPYYLKPGFSYGGSCLPKDLMALKTMAHDLYLDSPVLGSIEASNQSQIQNVVDIVSGINKNKIGVLGLAFKAGTDDMRNSPIISVIESLYGRGFEIKIYDKNVSTARIIGKNKGVLTNELPHLNTLLIDNIEEVIEDSEILIIANKDIDFIDINSLQDTHVIDLVRVEELECLKNYHGLCW